MPIEQDATRGVRSVYGNREIGYDIGHIKTEGTFNELSVGLSGSMLDDIIDGNEVVATVKIPAGSRIAGAYLTVDEAFVMTGTAVIVHVGTDGSESTNGCPITEAQLETAQALNLTSALAGTWDEAVLAAETTVGVAVAGTSPTSERGTGKARLVIQYQHV